MKLFTREELELLRLEAGRKRIADLRAKLQRMKQMAATDAANHDDAQAGHSGSDHTSK